MPEPPRLPTVVAVPCPVCGQEAVVQVQLTSSPVGVGLGLQAKVVKQCGCLGAPPRKE